MARSAEAAPFAYVANVGDNTVSVIDTATNPPAVVATIPVGVNPTGVAVAPDGKHAYVANHTTPGTVSVIDTAVNMVVATVALGAGPGPQGVAVTPDGKHAYVTGSVVSVIDTATNTVVATVPVFGGPIAIAPDGKHAYVGYNELFPNCIPRHGCFPFPTGHVAVIDTATNTVMTSVLVRPPFPSMSRAEGVAVTPDGKHAYVATFFDGTVSVIDTATNTVMTTLAVGSFPVGVAVTPDGKHAYVANEGSGTVSVIDTATNTVLATIPVGNDPQGVAVTPDGKHAYVAIFDSDTVSVLDTATNTVVATVPVGTNPRGVGIVPPPPGIPFLAFSAKLEIDLDRAPNEDSFELQSSFTLSSTAPRINPVKEAVKLQVGTFTVTIPPGSFKKHKDGSFTFEGVIHGVSLEALIKPAGTLRYAFHAEATDASLAGTVNTVYVTLIIGDDSGATSVKAAISP